MSSSDYIIKLENINKSFKSPKGRVSVLKNVNIDVKKGEVLSLVGPNGAGKSTLLRIIAGLILPESGKILWSDDCHSGRPIFIGSSERGFYYRLSGIDNLRFFIKIAGAEFDKGGENFTSLLERLKLKDIIDKRYQTYSAGERQRFSLLYAILTKPPLFVIDEFSQSIDIRSQKDLAHLLKENINSDNGAIIATHQIGIVKDVADRIAFLRDGVLVAVGSFDEISSKYFKANEFRLIICGDCERAGEIDGILITVIERQNEKTIIDLKYDGSLGDVINLLERFGFVVISAERSDSNLVEVYRRVIE
ncbi:MAG: ATP-binding cassette domain-containing protein [bacterium]